MKLTIENVCAGYNGKTVLHGVSTAVHTGEIICLLGPNGSGKTTLFRSVLGLLPSTGTIRFGDACAGRPGRRERSRLVAYVPQLHIPPFPFSGLEVVLAGRTPYMGLFSDPAESDMRAAREALDRAGASAFAGRNYAELSGGERQLVLIARALAQAPRFLVMDEPASHLDYGNQLRVIAAIRALASEGMGIILTTHTPDHAFLCATRVIALHRGTVIADGPPQQVLTESVLGTLYGVNVEIVVLPDGRHACIPATTEVTVA